MNFWPRQASAAPFNYRESIKFNIAAELIRHWGVVAGKSDREDTSGRAVCDLQTPEEVVDRAMTIADIFVDRCAEKEWIVEDARTDEEMARYSGKMAGIQRTSGYEADRAEMNALKETMKEFTKA